MLACAADLLARSLKLRYDGTAIASRMPRMMMTTRSSIRVKHSSEARRVVRRVMIGRASPSSRGGGWLSSYRSTKLNRASPGRGIRLTSEERRKRRRGACAPLRWVSIGRFGLRADVCEHVGDLDQAAGADLVAVPAAV